MYMNENNFSLELKMRLRHYFTQCNALMRERAHHHLVEQMSPQLRAQAMRFINVGWMRKIPLFDSVPECDKDDFLTTVSMSLRAEAYAKVRPLTRD
jgi:hypothetical protein